MFLFVTSEMRQVSCVKGQNEVLATVELLTHFRRTQCALKQTAVCTGHVSSIMYMQAGLVLLTGTHT